jgi:hypothetical protein
MKFSLRRALRFFNGILSSELDKNPGAKSASEFDNVLKVKVRSTLALTFLLFKALFSNFVAFGEIKNRIDVVITLTLPIIFEKRATN